ncbi:DUF4926 domain-containing protein [Clostridium estertheticum]|uniref:DUF4926 domain-containing protein n=1 Tax=Clostridium estertheticum TaxID=238834 RepID=UPI0013E983CE|nr:DUF4926 domain-containing protein [Clostridium estertheticum]MBZ9688508.1 DUF4926 domain-containing protein [Clostridium estertheticum]
MDLFDVVALKSNFPEGGLVKGQKGTILEIYNPKYVEVEFSDKKGITIYLGTFCKDDLDLIWSNETESYIKDML